MDSWKKAVIEEWTSRASRREAPKSSFPLIEQNFDSAEILAMIETILSGQLTMAGQVREFERQFAAFLRAPYAVMVNSGSSANLLAFAAAINIKRQSRLQPGDEVLIPAVCWSTSLWPILQCGLTPKFVDVDPTTLNIHVQKLEQALTPKTKALLAVHILGNTAPMDLLHSWTQKHNLMLIEDTCESLGSEFQDQKLGTIGDFGTYSFYYSHHMTTGEGGMVTCKTLEDYDLLRCLRAHGWSRELSNRSEFEAAHPNIDPRFLFVNMGFNLRPMEIQAALGIRQLGKLNEMNRIRIENHANIIQALKAHPKWNDQFEFIQSPKGAKPVWFGFCALLSSKHGVERVEFLRELTQRGVENRPVVSGNFVRQPALKTLGLNLSPEDFPGAEEIEKRGFFIGVHTTLLSKSSLSYLANSLLSAADILNKRAIHV